MRAVNLALKDLLEVIRDRKAAFFLVAMPILFTLFFGFIFGSFGAAKDPRLPVGFVNYDGADVVSTGLQSLLETSDVIRLVVLEGEKAERVAESVRDGDLAAAVIVPAGFGEQFLQASAGEEPRLTLIADRNTLAGETAGSAVQAAVTRLLGAVVTARLSAEVYEARQPFADEAARRAYLEEALALASAAWDNPPLAIKVERAGAPSDTASLPSALPNPYAHSSAGMVVQFAIYGLIISAMVLVVERKSRTLQRLLTTPITRVEVIAGHVLAMFVVVLLQEVLLLAFGQLALGVNYMREPVGTLLMVVTLALWTASLGLLIGAIARSEEQVIMWALLAMFIFSAMGGAWFPLEVTGKTFAAIGHLMPTAWAMDGFRNIVIRGLGLRSVLLPTGVLLAYTVVFFALAVWRFRFE